MCRTTAAFSADHLYLFSVLRIGVRYELYSGLFQENEGLCCCKIQFHSHMLRLPLPVQLFIKCRWLYEQSRSNRSLQFLHVIFFGLNSVKTGDAQES